MCGRFAHPSDFDSFLDYFVDVSIEGFEQGPRWNVAPSQVIPTLLAEDGDLKLKGTGWGLVPFWQKKPAEARRPINARAEGIADKPMFREPFKYRRCVVPACGFYEWKAIPGQKGKQPVYFSLKDGSVFGFAALYDVNTHGPERIETSVLITTSPNELVQDVHNRMPVILTAEDSEKWLFPPDGDPSVAEGLLKPFPADLMINWPVSSAVNNPSFDGPECAVPYELPQQQELF